MSRAFWNIVRSVGFVSGSPPPSWAATSTCRSSLANSLPRALSLAAFLCLMVAHLEWPDITPPRSRNSSCRRGSSPSSGWNAAASTGPWRHRTGWPSTVARTSTSAPTSSTHGARMNTAWTGAPSSPSTAMSASNESTWRPKALRRTPMSMAPKQRWSGRPSRMSRPSRIMPAQVPRAGRPASSASATGSNSPDDSSSIDIVVDSPPGSTRAPTPSRSAGERTVTGWAPRRASMEACSRRRALQREHADLHLGASFLRT